MILKDCMYPVRVVIDDKIRSNYIAKICGRCWYYSRIGRESIMIAPFFEAEIGSVRGDLDLRVHEQEMEYLQARLVATGMKMTPYRIMVQIEEDVRPTIVDAIRKRAGVRSMTYS